MEIYILRDGTELGPFSEEDTQLMLKQGSVVISDLAWSPGMPQWIPLHSVLYPAPPVAAAFPPPPPAAVAPIGEPATPRQKAFLSYMGIAFSPEITKPEAALLESDAVESPRDPARLSRWNEERLRLHPEIFAAELQAKKDNRASHFFEAAQTEGAECFTGVGKAHCQVLINYLDTKFPNWDARESEASWSYFFPAIAEKFPQLVNKEWRDKLKFPDGPKVAAELHRKTPVNRSPYRRKASPIAAMAKGLVFGVVVLGLIAGGFWVSQHPELLEKVKTLAAKQAAPAAKPSPAKAPVAEKKSPEPGPQDSLFGAPATSLAPAATTASTPAAAAPADPAMVAETMTPAPPTDATAATMQPAPAPSGLFDPNASMQPAAANGAGGLFSPTPPAATAATPPPAQRTTVVLNRAVDVQLGQYGRAKIPAGSSLKMLSHDATTVKVSFQNTVVSIPVTSTDLAPESAVLPQ